jgi:hypothetical protein
MTKAVLELYPENAQEEEKRKLEKFLAENVSLLMWAAIKTCSIEMVNQVLGLYPADQQSKVLAATLNDESLPMLVVPALRNDDPAFLQAFLALYEHEHLKRVLRYQTKRGHSLLSKVAERHLLRTFDFLMTQYELGDQIEHTQQQISQAFNNQSDHRQKFRAEHRKLAGIVVGQEHLDPWEKDTPLESIYHMLSTANRLRSYFSDRIVDRMLPRNPNPTIYLKEHAIIPERANVFHWKLWGDQTSLQKAVARGDIDFITLNFENNLNLQAITQYAQQYGKITSVYHAWMRIPGRQAVSQEPATSQEVLQCVLAASQQPGPYQQQDKRIILSQLLSGTYCAQTQAEKDLQARSQWGFSLQRAMRGLRLWDKLCAVTLSDLKLAQGPLIEEERIRTLLLIVLYADHLNEESLCKENLRLLMLDHSQQLEVIVGSKQFQALMTLFHKFDPSKDQVEIVILETPEVQLSEFFVQPPAQALHVDLVPIPTVRFNAGQAISETTDPSELLPQTRRKRALRDAGR